MVEAFGLSASQGCENMKFGAGPVSRIDGNDLERLATITGRVPKALLLLIL